ncbi:MAG: DNA-protecting protein DprA, partial [Ruminiclostridium sp.]|nr:DNA-protecting protein DprA [Ruminiclostridium sp.]
MRYYIYLLQIFGGGNPKIHEIIRAYGSAKAVYEKVSAGDMTLIPSNRVENAKKASVETSDRIISFCKKNKISIITIDDKDYPVMLKNIYNPPTGLFVEGDLSCLNKRLAISVVGPRRPDTYAIRLAANICGGLASCRSVLVSGFANGIDSIAHSECIKRKVPTVAVLACGHTVEYPAHSFGVRAQIKKAGGAVISELLPDTECCRGYFKFRNRIISGLGHGTVVIGADNRSGSMLTANNAFEQDRD